MYGTVSFIVRAMGAATDGCRAQYSPPAPPPARRPFCPPRQPANMRRHVNRLRLDAARLAPELVGDSTSPSSWRPPCLVLLGLGLVGLWRYADTYRRGEVTLAQLKSGLEHLSAIDAEATTAGEASDDAELELAGVNFAIWPPAWRASPSSAGRAGLRARPRSALLGVSSRGRRSPAPAARGEADAAEAVRIATVESADLAADAAIDAPSPPMKTAAEAANALAAAGSLGLIVLARRGRDRPPDAAQPSRGNHRRATHRGLRQARLAFARWCRTAARSF